MFELLLTSVAVVAGAIASVVGFAIGSLLTPVLALRVEMNVAVAAVSIPHLAGTAVRFWRLRGHVDRRVLRIPDSAFRRIVAVILAVVGTHMLIRAAAG